MRAKVQDLALTFLNLLGYPYIYKCSNFKRKSRMGLMKSVVYMQHILAQLDILMRNTTGANS